MFESEQKLFESIEIKEIEKFANIVFRIADLKYREIGLAAGVAVGYQNIHDEFYCLAATANQRGKRGWQRGRGIAIAHLESTLAGGNNVAYEGVLVFPGEITSGVGIFSDDGKWVDAKGRDQRLVEEIVAIAIQEMNSATEV